MGKTCVQVPGVCDLVTTDRGEPIYTGSVAVFTPEILNRFRSGFTYKHGLNSMVWTVKNDFDVDPFNVNRKVGRWVVSIWV